MSKKLIKKKDLYFPSKEFKKNALINKKSIYKEAEKSQIKFWEKLAKELFWFKKWKKVFVHKPPYFQWFTGGKINITSNIFENNSKGFEKIKNKVALIWEPEPVNEQSRTFTYAELYAEVNRFANALKKMGVKKGDKVGIYLPMIPEAIVSMLACARIGAIHVVVFSAFSPTALRVRLQDTEAKVLITADGYNRRGKVVDLKKNADEGMKDTKVKKAIVIKRAENKVRMKKGRDFWWNDLKKDQSDFCKAEIMDAEDILFILYTSGSTGKPKGTVQACGGYTVQAKFTGKYIFDFQNSDIFWSTADVGWITGHTYSCYSPLLNAATYLIFEGAPGWPKPNRWAKIIEKYKVTIFYTAPTAIRMFAKFGLDILKGIRFNTLRLIGSVGEPIDESAWMWYFEKVGKQSCPVVDTWWQTETGGILITSLPGIGPFKPCFTGLPFPGTKFKILNDRGRECKTGERGNLVLLPPFTPGLLRGVYKNPKRYLKTYWSQYGKKIYFTSDAAYKDKNGLIRVVGRVDDVMKVAGHRLSTGEMEDSISKIDYINECAVIGMPDQIKGEVPAVFLVLKKNAVEKKRFTEDIYKEIQLKVRKEIGPIAGIKKVFVVEDLPKTRSGKIMRRILKRLFTGEPLGDLSTLANADSVQKIKEVIKLSD